MDDDPQALRDAARGGDQDPARRLIEAGVDPDAAEPRSGRTSLHYAVRHAGVAMVDLLLAHGASADARDASGGTPLHALGGAIRLVGTERTLGAMDLSDAAAIVQRLVAAGADPDARDASGRTTLHVAAFEGQPEVVEALLAAGADPDPRNAAGLSPVHVAAGAAPGVEWYRILELLCEAGADPTARTTDAWTIWETEHPARSTPEDIAERHDHPRAVEILRDYPPGGRGSAEDRATTLVAQVIALPITLPLTVMTWGLKVAVVVMERVWPEPD